MKQAIGVFDSGVGGLSVWKELVKILPNEDLVYYADNANCPYGPKSKEEVIALSKKVASFLIEQNVKMVVVACNTATAAAIDYLRTTYSIPFVGMEPAIKPAALNTKTGCIGVLATAGTLSGSLFNATRQKYAADKKVIMQVGTGLVELVESARHHSDEARTLLMEYISPMLEANADQIVLGCTHYPFFRPLVDDIAGPNVTIVDSAPAVAKRAYDLLKARNMLYGANEPAHHCFYSSGKADTMRLLLEHSLNVDPKTICIKENARL